MAIRERSTGDAVTATVQRCTRCGCTDIRKEPGQAPRCRHCGKVYVERSVPVEEAVDEADKPTAIIYHVIRCPACNSDNCKVTSTRRPLRYHQCKDCGTRFKSHEK